MPPVAHQELQARGEQREDQDLGPDRQERSRPRRAAAGRRGDERRPRPRAARRREQGRQGRISPADRGAGRPFRPAEQPVGPHDQHDRHHQRRRARARSVGRTRMPKAFSSETMSAATIGARDAAEPADHHDDEDLDDDAQVHRVADGVARQLQGAAERRQEDAEREHAREQPALVRRRAPPPCRGPASRPGPGRRTACGGTGARARPSTSGPSAIRKRS